MNTRSLVIQAMDDLLTAINASGFDTVRDSVTEWAQAQLDADDPPVFVETLAAEIAFALTVANDADACADATHIRVTTPIFARARSFRFSAERGASPAMLLQIATTVEDATTARGHPAAALDLLKLFLPHAPRPWRIGTDCGDVFREGDDFDGWTLTLALDDEAQADALARTIRKTHPHWQPDPDSPGVDHG